MNQFDLRQIIRFVYLKIKKLKELKFPSVVKYIPNGNFKVSHISSFCYGNAGDTLLPVVLRDLFNQEFGVKKWRGLNVDHLVSNKDVNNFNSDDFVVIGGGGLFLSDTSPNDISGWQWNCSIEELRKINKPIIAFAIGYNRFRGQSDFKPIFRDHLNVFVSKCSFIGLRNHGSINKVKDYLDTDALKEKLVFQPCMTTLISHIYPNYTNYKLKEDFIAFNCAFDRQDMRALNKELLYAISRVAKILSNITKIKYYVHSKTDRNILPIWDELGVDYEIIELKNVSQIIRAYSIPKLVIGMRGHAQLIPFGCLTPILSIISHDKMQYFLDDIHHPEWGVDVLDNGFEENLYDKAVKIYSEYDKNIKEIEKEQDLLWEITKNNMNNIKSIINK